MISDDYPQYGRNYHRTQFKINNYLTLRLERGASNIYVAGRLFNQCKYLLLDIPLSNARKFKNIESIDEAIESLSRGMEGGGRNSVNVSPQAEFWGHCSNLQAWAENNYDTRILHRNLAFPLLKALADAGDPKARRVFKEEIAMRLVSGYPSVVEYLSQQGYFHYLGREEVKSICEDPEFLKAIIKNYNYFVERSNYFELFYDKARNLLPNLLLTALSDVNSHKYAQRLIAKIINSHDSLRRQLMGLLIDKLEDGEFYTDISDIINIFGLDFLIQNIPYSQMNRLLEDPNSVFHGLLLRYKGKIIAVQNSEVLDLRGKNIKDLAHVEGLLNFTDITKIVLDDNDITEITGLEILQNLQEISIKNNKLEKIQGFEQFPNLVKLNLNNNLIEELTGLKRLKRLKTLNLSQNKILEIDCRELPHAENINLAGNLLMRIKNPNSLAKILYKINNRIAVSLEGKEIKILIDKNPSILLKDHSIHIQKNGLVQKYSMLDQKYSGFAEFTPIDKEIQSRKKTNVHISEVYPLDIKNDTLDGNFREICSNLKIWAENNYDLRVLRKDIVFPLVEQLGDIKDSLSKKLLTKVKDLKLIKPEQPKQMPNDGKDLFSKKQESLVGTTLKRKLFSATTNELLSILSFKNFHEVEVRLLNPMKRQIREFSEMFVHIFLKGALIKIKESNPNLSLEYDYFKNSDLIETIKISNLNSIQDYDLITVKMQELLATV